MQRQLTQVAGEQVVAFQPAPLPGSNGLPVQVVIGTTQPFDHLNQVAENFLQEAAQSHLFAYLDSDLKIDQPQFTVKIDRDKTSQLGLQMSDIGGALTWMLGGGYVNYVSLDGRSYKVIPQVQQRYRLNTDQLLNYYIGVAADGTPIPLSTVAKVTAEVVPESLNHFQQLNAATIEGVTARRCDSG